MFEGKLRTCEALKIRARDIIFSSNYVARTTIHLGKGKNGREQAVVLEKGSIAERMLRTLVRCCRDRDAPLFQFGRYARVHKLMCRFVCITIFNWLWLRILSEQEGQQTISSVARVAATFRTPGGGSLFRHVASTSTLYTRFSPRLSQWKIECLRSPRPTSVGKFESLASSSAFGISDINFLGSSDGTCGRRLCRSTPGGGHAS